MEPLELPQSCGSDPAPWWISNLPDNSMHRLASSLVATGLLPLISAHASAQLQFSNQTTEAGLLAPNTHTLVHDDLPGDTMFPTIVAGACVGDFNNDGYPDIYQAAGGLRRDKLFINNGDGTFTDRAGEWGIAVGHQGSAPSVGDFNGDGFLDIFVASHGPTFSPAPGFHRLYRNNGGTSFTEVGTLAKVNFSSPTLCDGFGTAAGDYDLDGDLDLFITGWRQDPNPSMGNRLFRNRGNGTFTDVTDEAGVGDLDMRGFAPTFADMDGDRYPELLVVSDFGTSRYFKNNGDGTFTDLTVVSGTGLDANGMGSAVGDVNGDGLLDWYATSIYELPEDPLKDGNKLYINQGNHQYTEVAASAGIDDGGWGWGTVMVDFDHDGDLDIAETNGWPRVPWIGEQSYLFLNDGTGLSYTEVALPLGIDHAVQGRACLNLDYDLDGDQDLIFTANRGLLQLFRNDLPQSPDTAYLRLTFDTSANSDLAPRGFGTKVRVDAGGESYWRVLDGGCHFMGTSELAVHFGLGSATEIDTLEVFWADGTTKVLTDVAINQNLVITAD